VSHPRTISLFALIALVLGGLHAFTGRPPTAPEGKTIMDLWYPWIGPDGEAMRRLVDVFNKNQNSIFVRTLFVPDKLSSNQKLFLSVAAGTPPDCAFVDGTQVCEWAARGAIQPLDDLMARYGVQKDDFWEPCVRQCQFRGKTYAITYCADPNFAFLWNKKVFAEAGMLEAGPPRTIEELDQKARALTAYDSRGRITRIGCIPWSVFGYANSIFTWGWAFGGNFYDDQTGRIICGEDPGVLEALKWMKSYADEYGFEKVNSFSEGFGAEADNPFIRGKIAMAVGHVINIRLFKQYAPDLDYGVTSMPYPARMGFDHSAWFGGWGMGIPRGAESPDAAFQFMKWLCTSAEGGRSMIAMTGMFPGYKRSAGFELVKGNAKLEIFYGILQNTRHQRPVMPAQAYFMGALDRAVVDTLTYAKTPEQALRDAQMETQRELDRVMTVYVKAR